MWTRLGSCTIVTVMEWLVYFQWGLLAGVAVLGMIAVSNLYAFRYLGEHTQPGSWPHLSVLVPARNEAENIGACVQSLLQQDYPNFEVLVLDDHSTDGTGAILAALAEHSPRLRVLTGAPLPPGWMGKNWACHQLSQAATGELLLFTDADTHHHPATLREAVATMQAKRVDMLTVLPRFIVRTWAECLSVPLIASMIFFVLPVGLAHRLQLPSMASVLGAFMLFRRTALEGIGGYAAIRSQVQDDLILGRRLMASGRRWRIVDATHRVECRMYRNFRQVFEGFSKNMFPGFGYRLSLFISVWLLAFSLFVEPWLLLGAALLGMALPPQAVVLALASVALTLVLLLIVLWRFRFPFFLVVAYPLVLGFMAVIGLNSLRLATAGRATWKGREIGERQSRLRL